MSGLTLIPYTPKPFQGSFDHNTTQTHTSCWGTCHWPHDLFDLLNGTTGHKTKPSPKSTEDFININGLRHLLYEQFSLADNGDLSNYTGFLMSRPIINSEAPTEMVNLRRKIIAAETKHWSAELQAPIRIAQPRTFKDLQRVKVQLPSSLFLEEEPKARNHTYAPLETFLEERFTNLLPMSSLSLEKLDFTTYADDVK
jgi:hypothetical protein